MVVAADTTLGEVVRSTGGRLQTGPFGSQLHASDYQAEGTPLVMPFNMGDNVIRGVGIARVGPEDVKRLSRHRLRAGDIVFSRRGDVGRRSIVRPENEGWLCGTGCLAAKFGPKRRDVNPMYVALLMGRPDIQAWLADKAVGGTMPNLNTAILSSLPLRLPPRDQQDAVVQALEGIGELVMTLERLIAKKRNVEQGMMQELLTGRTRLPGFTGEWKVLPVADSSHLKARIGWQGLTTREYLTSGEYRLVGGTDFENGHVDWEAAGFVDKWRFDQDKNIQLVNGDVLITKDGTIGKVAIVDSIPGPSTLNSGVFVLRPVRDAYIAEFVYWMLRSRVFEEFIAGLSAGSTITHLYQRDLVTLELLVPPTLEEQSAIARLLTDADTEIEALERRLESARAVKVGIMQELLTGRTRLPVEEEA